MAATLDGLIDPRGAVFEVYGPLDVLGEVAAETHMAQLEHNLWMSDAAG